MIINYPGHMAKMAAMPMYGKKSPAQEPVDETLHVATGPKVLQCVYK